MNKLQELYDRLKTKPLSSSIAEEISSISEQYRKIEIIGKGGCKEVWKAYDKKSSRVIALAIPINPTDVETVESFLYEARLSAHLEHPNIIPVYEVNVTEVPFFTMKLITGDSLNTLIKKKKAEYSLIQLMHIYLKICHAVSYAHSRGVVHLDLKPENIHVDKFGEVLVLDWGLAERIFSVDEDDDCLFLEKYQTHSAKDLIKGTPGFMAPEQILIREDVIDERTDIFSMGVLLFTLLTKSTPFSGETVDDIIKNTLSKEITFPLNCNAPESLKAVTEKSLAKNKENRYQSVSDLADDIELFLNGFATKAEDAGFFKQLILLLYRNLKITILGMSALVIIILLIIGFISKLQESQEQTNQALLTAIKEKKKVELALNKYENEKREKIKMGQFASGLLDLKTSLLNINLDLEDTKDKLELAILAAPDNNDVITQKGIFHFIMEEFQQAESVLKKSTSTAYTEFLISLSNKYSSKEDSTLLDDSKLIELFSTLMRNNKRWLPAAIMTARVRKNGLTETHISLIYKLLKIYNPKQKTWEQQILRRTGEGLHVSLDGYKNIKNMFPLSGLEIYSLNLSNMGEISFSDFQYTHINHLTLLNTKLTNVNALLNFKYLKSVTVSRNDFSEKQLDRLKKSFEVKFWKN